ncbi:hypothetical protein JCM30394_24430 [Deferrisoma palaeochoriense]
MASSTFSIGIIVGPLRYIHWSAFRRAGRTHKKSRAGKHAVAYIGLGILGCPFLVSMETPSRFFLRIVRYAGFVAQLRLSPEDPRRTGGVATLSGPGDALAAPSSVPFWGRPTPKSQASLRSGCHFLNPVFPGDPAIRTPAGAGFVAGAL